MRIVALIGLAAFLLAGCSDGGSANGGPPTPRLEDGKHVIEMRGQQFVPNDAAIPAGATVVWVNAEITPHDVTASDGSWTSDTEFPTKMQRDDRYSHTFTTAGVVEYFCKIHPAMTGKLTVG